MIVVRFKVKCKPEKREQTKSTFLGVVAPSRMLEGVVSFDIAQDISDPDSFIATEVFVDQASLARQESIPEVQQAIGLLGELLAAEPEATIFHVSSSEPWGN